MPTRVIANLDAIRQYNPQRFEMEQLTAVVYEDTDHHICVGYKDLAIESILGAGSCFVRSGHAANIDVRGGGQLANCYALRHNLYAAQGGFVALKDVRCRGIVRPGERLFVLAKLLENSRHSVDLPIPMCCSETAGLPWSLDRRRICLAQ